MTTYTEHKLTEAQCKRLSQIYNLRPHLHGVALDALKRKGLVVVDPDGHYPKTCFLTAEGKAAFKQARQEGW